MAFWTFILNFTFRVSTSFPAAKLRFPWKLALPASVATGRSHKWRTAHAADRPMDAGIVVLTRMPFFLFFFLAFCYKNEGIRHKFRSPSWQWHFNLCGVHGSMALAAPIYLVDSEMACPFIAALFASFVPTTFAGILSGWRLCQAMLLKGDLS